MKYWEQEVSSLIASFEAQFGHGPTAILAWNDAFSRFKADWRNTVICKGSQKIIWNGYEVIRVDAPGDRIILDGGVLFRDYEE